MNEAPFYFTNGKNQLFGILHRPEKKIHHLGFVFVHPFAEEKLWTQRVYVNFARELCRQDHPVLRFDFTGHGDSEGDFANTSVNTRLRDIEVACGQLMKEIPEVKTICLLGLRFGGTLAALSAESVKDVSRLILWEPVIDGEKYMQEMLRINLTTQSAVYKKIINNREQLIELMKNGETVNIDGYELSHELFSQAAAINLVAAKATFSGKCLILQIARKTDKIRKELEDLKNNYTRAELGASSEFSFWKEIKAYYATAENVYHDTLNWLGETDD